MSLEKKIGTLASAFARELVGALLAAPVEELAVFSATVPAGASVPASASSIGKKAAARKPARVAEDKGAARRQARAAAEENVLARIAALAWFRVCGKKGTTAVHLQAQLESGDAATVIAQLAADGVVRDAGIRRATGKGTAPVYVIASA